MPNTAILVGNTEYRSLAQLDCCRADVAAMRELLDATEKYETIEIIENADANELKSTIRAAVEKAKSPAELFFLLHRARLFIRRRILLLRHEFRFEPPE